MRRIQVCVITHFLKVDYLWEGGGKKKRQTVGPTVATVAPSFAGWTLIDDESN